MSKEGHSQIEKKEQKSENAMNTLTFWKKCSNFLTCTPKTSNLRLLFNVFQV